jgi:RNA polymerase subunit RPABC4/transcription elongation factor Spt4
MTDREKLIKLKHCPWCTDHKGRTDLNFSVIDDDFCQYVKNSMINFCPFCGKKLKTKE